MPAKEEKTPEDALLAVVRDAFDQQGTWPTWQYVEAVIDQDHHLELEEVLAGARRSRVFSNGIRDGSEVILTVAGLAAADAERDVRRFVEALRWCVAEQMGFRPDPGEPQEVKIEAGQFKSEWETRGEEVSATDLRKLRAMLVVDGIYGSIGGEDGKWTLSLNRRGLLPYRDVFTVEDYLALRDPPPDGSEDPPKEAPKTPEIVVTRRSQVAGSTAERHWRGLYAEFSELLDRYFSRQQTADLFYEYGVTETPAAPPETETIRGFTIEQLHHGNSIPTFLRNGLPKTVLDLGLEGVEVATICRRLETLGYTQEEVAEEKGVPSYVPPKRLPRTPVAPRRERGSVHARVQSGDLPSDLKELVEELNDNLRRDNRYAAALLTRKIIGQAVYVAMARRGLQAELKRPDGDDLDLAAALVRCKEACGIPAQVMARVTTAKWIGDTANHSYRAKVSPEELERTVTGVSLFLKELL